jgi:hypothetical protein
MRRFLIRDIAVRSLIRGRGVAFDDDVIGVRWEDEPRMTLVFMDQDTFAASLEGAPVRLIWLDPPSEYQ